MLYNLPIESLEERYSATWNREFPKAFQKLAVPVITLHPDLGEEENKILVGQFLDVIKTNEFKAKQLSELMCYFNENLVCTNDVVFVQDGWFPGLEMLFYIRDGLGLNFKIAVMLHAGTYDPHDFLTQKRMDRWAAGIETAWWSEVDAVFVATEFHQMLLTKYRNINPEKVYITGFPLFDDSLYTVTKKENIVVFPHRLAPEKNPQDFDYLTRLCSSRMSGWRFIKSKEVCKTKKEYYDLLQRSKIAVSCADQETWGIAQQEALFRGCIPVVPNRLSYCELYDSFFRYDNLAEAADKIIGFSGVTEVVHNGSAFRATVNRCYQKSESAIPNMIKIMRDKGWRV